MSNNTATKVLQAAEIVATAKMSEIKFDRTDLCTVVKVYTEEEKKFGWYRVSNGSAKFDAKPLDDTQYKEKDQVYVLIPKSDYSLDKVILGAYKSDEEKRYSYTNPLERIKIARQLPTIVLEKSISVEPTPQITTDSVATWGDNLVDPFNANEAQKFPKNGYGDYELMLLTLNLQTNFTKYKGSYGITLNFLDSSSAILHSIDISSVDFYGNPYYLDPTIPLLYLVQMPKSLDMTKVVSIQTFLWQDGKFDQVDIINEKTISLSKIAIAFGYDAEKITASNEIKIVQDTYKTINNCLTANNYSPDSEDGKNLIKKYSKEYEYDNVIRRYLSINTLINGKFYDEYQFDDIPQTTKITTGFKIRNDDVGNIGDPYVKYTISGYRIYWCQYNIAKYNNPDYLNIPEADTFWAVRRSEFIKNINDGDITHNNEKFKPDLPHKRKDPFAFRFKPNLDWDKEQFKVIIRKETTEFHYIYDRAKYNQDQSILELKHMQEKNTVVDNSFTPIILDNIVFKNTTTAVPQETLNTPGDSIKLTLGGDGNTGKYYVYGGDGEIVSPGEKNKERFVTASYFDNREWGSLNETVTWEIPKKGSMIIPHRRNETITKPEDDTIKKTVADFIATIDFEKDAIKGLYNKDTGKTQEKFKRTLTWGLVQLSSLLCSSSPGFILDVDKFPWPLNSDDILPKEDWHAAWVALIESDISADELDENKKKVTIDRINQLFKNYGPEWVWVKSEIVEDNEIVDYKFLKLEIVNISWDENDDYYYINADAHETNQTVQYKLSSIYYQTQGNNYITCTTIIPGGKTFQGKAIFTAGLTNLNGTTYKLSIEPEHQYGLEANQEIEYTATLFNEQGIDMTENVTFSWDWFYGNHDGKTTGTKKYIIPPANDYNSTASITLTTNSTTTNKCVVSRNSTTINNIPYSVRAKAILKVSCTVETISGNRTIEAYYPIGLGANNHYLLGATRIVFDALGKPKSSDETPYTIISKEGFKWSDVKEENNNNKKSFHSIWLKPAKEGETIVSKSENPDHDFPITDDSSKRLDGYPGLGKENVLIPPTALYSSENLEARACFVYIKIPKENNDNDFYYWVQPILMYSYSYDNTFVNNWDGISVKIDEKNGKILTQYIGAGTKNKTNEFTGVMMGKVEYGGINTHGLYGFKNNDRVFSFDEYGKAFIGNSTNYLAFDPTDSNNTFNLKINEGVVNIGNDDVYFKFNPTVDTDKQLEIQIKTGLIAGWNITDHSFEKVADRLFDISTIKNVTSWDNIPDSYKKRYWMIYKDSSNYYRYDYSTSQWKSSTKAPTESERKLITGIQIPSAESSWAISVSATNNDDWSTGVFKVRHDGRMFATGADISGTITAESGTIGDWSIADNASKTRIAKSFVGLLPGKDENYYLSLMGSDKGLIWGKKYTGYGILINFDPIANNEHGAVLQFREGSASMTDGYSFPAKFYVSLTGKVYGEEGCVFGNSHNNTVESLIVDSEGGAMNNTWTYGGHPIVQGMFGTEAGYIEVTGIKYNSQTKYVHFHCYVNNKVQSLKVQVEEIA